MYKLLCNFICNKNCVYKLEQLRKENASHKLQINELNAKNHKIELRAAQRSQHLQEARDELEHARELDDQERMRLKEQRMAVPKLVTVSIEHTGVQIEKVLLNKEVQTSFNNFFLHVLHYAAAQFHLTQITSAISIHNRASLSKIFIEDDIIQTSKAQVMNYQKKLFQIYIALIQMHIFYLIYMQDAKKASRYKRLKSINRSSPCPLAERFKRRRGGSSCCSCTCGLTREEAKSHY